jgi:hypothetical protein
MVLIRALIFLTFIFVFESCGVSETKEYFCETPFVDDNHFYSQTILKINKNEFCVMYKGEKYSCVRFNEKISDNLEDDSKGFTQTQYSYKAILTNDIASMIVLKQESPKKTNPVIRKLVGDEYHFIFNDVELGITLNKKEASDDNLRTYDLYAINNVANWSGRMIHCGFKDEDGSCHDIKSYSVGGEAFNSWYRAANNLPTYQYDFDLKNLTLKTDPFDKLLPITSYSCEIWKKQKWWNL